jgi:hypothetical protein
MEALRRSVGGTAAETKAPKKVAKKPRKPSAGQKEMLSRSIPGKKQTKETTSQETGGATAEVGLNLAGVVGRLVDLFGLVGHVGMWLVG